VTPGSTAAADAADATDDAGLLPALWRFDVGTPHAAFAFGDGWITLVQRDPREQGEAPLGEHGEVVAAFTASRVWPAAHALAVALVGRGYDGHVLELGAGTGLVGLALAKVGARRVTLTDLAENLGLMERNARANHFNDGAVRVVALDWLADDLPREIIDDPPDVVAVADCVFWPHLFSPLLATLERLVSLDRARASGGHLEVWISVTHRLDRTDLFFRELERRGWWKRQEPVSGAAFGTAVFQIGWEATVTC